VNQYLTASIVSYLKSFIFKTQKDAIARAMACQGWSNRRQLSLLFYLAEKTAGLGGDILEIGSAWGRSTVLLGYASKKSIWSIDPHTGGRAFIEKGIEQNSYDSFRENLEKNTILPNVQIIKNTSQEVLEKSLLPSDLKFSFVFIDGLHTAAGVKVDFEIAYPRLVKNGAMVFDDYFSPTVGDYKEMIDTLVNKHGINLIKDTFAKLVYCYK
jgi:predicted O-methyltransferase YrrM